MCGNCSEYDLPTLTKLFPITTTLMLYIWLESQMECFRPCPDPWRKENESHTFLTSTTLSQKALLKEIYIILMEVIWMERLCTASWSRQRCVHVSCGHSNNQSNSHTNRPPSQEVEIFFLLFYLQLKCSIQNSSDNNIREIMDSFCGYV